MNRLSTLRAKPELIKLGELDLNITGMTFPEMTEFAELADAKKTKDALNYLLFVTLRKATPYKEADPEDGMTDNELREEIKLMDGVKAMEIVKAVQKVSGITSDEPKKGEVDENPQENK